MVQDALIAAYRWLVGGAAIGLRLLPPILFTVLALVALALAARRLDPEGYREFRVRLGRLRLTGPPFALLAALLLGGALVQTRKIVVARRATVEGATASRRNEPSLSGVTQYAPAVAVLEEKTYRRTLILPPDFLNRIGAEGVQVLSPYLSDPSADEVLRLKDVFKRSGNDVVFTRDVVRRDETPVTADAAEVAVGFVGKGSRRHYEATFDGTYRFRNPRPADAAMRFSFPLPQGGGTLQEFSIEAAGKRVTDPDVKGLYAWSGTVPAGGEVQARVRYRVTGSGLYDYALGSERRRIGEFRLVATSDASPQYGRAGIYPTRIAGKESEWSLRDVITAQNVSIVFPQADVAAETFGKTLWWLPAILGLFALGASWIAPAGSLPATLAFGLGLLGIPVLSAYLSPQVATVVGAALAGTLGFVALPKGRALAPASGLLACAFLTVEHGALFVWVLATVGTAWALTRRPNAE